MQDQVIVLDAGSPISEAFRIFEEDQISGAPVVNEGGHLVGFLSSRDMTRSEHLKDGSLQTQRGDRSLADTVDEEWVMPTRDEYSSELLGRELVQDWMSPEIIAVSMDTKLVSICETIARERIHRVVVTEGRRVRGIVSTFDIVRWLAQFLSKS